MKKLLCVLLCLLICLVPLTAGAQESVEKQNITIKLNGEKTVADISWDIDLSATRTLMSGVLERILTVYTEQQIASIPQLSSLLLEIRPFLRLHIGDKTAVIPLESESGRKSFDLYSQLLTFFPDGTDFSEGVTVTADIIPATGNYPDEYAMTFDSQLISWNGSFELPGLVRIFYDCPRAAVNNNPEFLPYPLTHDVILESPVLTGSRFAGWTVNSAAVDRIPAGVKTASVKAVFSAREYKINYVLTTDITYSFGRADNTKNPTYYTYGESCALFPIKSPVGGYHFLTWLIDGKPVTEIPAGTRGDVLVYAKWVSDAEMNALQYINDYYELSGKGFCDIDGDGKVSVSDARLTLRAAIRLEILSAEALKRADIRGTGLITADNARQILRIAIGLDDIVSVYRSSKEEIPS